MKPSAKSNRPRVPASGVSRLYAVRVPAPEESLLKELMARLEINASQVVLKGIRRLAELEGLRQPALRPKRST